MIKRMLYRLHAIALLLALLAGAACSGNDEEPQGEERNFRTIEVVINSRTNAQPATRAEEVGTADDDEYERHIDQYWLVVTKQSETGTGEFLVDKIIDSDDLEYVTPGTDDKSETSLNVEVEIGKTYRFYALANLEGLQGGEAVISELQNTVGKPFGAFLSKAVNVKAMSEYKAEGGSPIPMSSYYVQQTIEENTAELGNPIQLIRLVGKVTLEVRNLTDAPVTLKSLKMGDFRTAGNVYLFPYDLAEGKGTQNLLAENQAEIFPPSFPTDPNAKFGGITLFDNQAGETIPVYDEADGSTHRSYSAYVNESFEDATSDLTVTTDIPDRNPAPVSIGTSFVRRNDWLKLPVQITEVETTISADQQHMPIGGLPFSITFQPIAFPIADFQTGHAGKVTFMVAVNSVSSMDNPVLKFYAGTVTGNETFTSAVLKSNNGEGQPLLINLPQEDATWPIDQVSFPLTAGTGNKSFTFDVTLQELAQMSNAIINLSLVIADGTGPNPRVMTIPYTLTITFTEGGN